jgi:putative transposase
LRFANKSKAFLLYLKLLLETFQVSKLGKSPEKIKINRVSMSTHYLKPLLPNNFFHILNRGNNGCKLFYNADNYIHFLRKYDQYLSDYLTTYAYSLLGNHFHILVKLKDTDGIIETAVNREDFTIKLSQLLKKDILREETAGLIVSNQFRKFFMAYAKAINNQERRTGSLFEKNFERILIDNIKYLNNVLHYIHYNPQHHGFVEDFKDYSWSSYDKILKPKPSKLPKHQIIESFGNKEKYICFHGENHSFSTIKGYIIE